LDILPGSATQTNTNVAVAEQTTAEALAGNARNHIALPLDASADITPFNAQGLLTYIGSQALLVENWNAQNGNLDFWDGSSGFGIINGVFTTDPADYPLTVGYPYLVTVDSSAPSETVFTIVGDVPAMNTIDFSLYGTNPCARNEIAIPLDQTGTGINTALDLANDITNVDLVEAWNATNQNLDFWDVGSGFGIINGVFTTDPNDFPVSMGYPYFVCVNIGSNGVNWPS
jgi:hypothetical protein